jgi:hypothetical protein
MHKHNDPENPVLYREQNRAAWRAMLKEIRNFLSIALLLSTVGWIGFLGVRWIESHNYVDLAIQIIVTVLCIVALSLLLWFRKESIRMNMFGTPEAWLTNPGQPPEGVERVSVERENGQREWNVAVTDIEWDLNEENPVKTYYPKKSKTPGI